MATPSPEALELARCDLNYSNGFKDGWNAAYRALQTETGYRDAMMSQNSEYGLAMKRGRDAVTAIRAEAGDTP